MNWVKSSYSTSDGGECVEYSPTFASSGVVPVRDSKDPDGPVLTFSSVAWADFVSAVKAGDLTG